MQFAQKRNMLIVCAALKIQCFKGPWYDSFQSLPSGGGSKHFFVVIKTILDQDETSFHPSYLVKNNFQCGSTTPDPPPQIQHGRPKVQIWFKWLSFSKRRFLASKFYTPQSWDTWNRLKKMLLGRKTFSPFTFGALEATFSGGKTPCYKMGPPNYYKWIYP